MSDPHEQLTEPEQTIPPAPVNGPLGNLGLDVQRVFVGVPDVFTTEQLARVNALHFVKEARWGLRKDDVDTAEEVAADWVSLADHFTQYMLNGTIPEVPAKPPAEVKS